MFTRSRRILIKRPVAASVIALAVCILGWTAALQLPIQSAPDLAGPTVFVTARLPGADAHQIAASLAEPLEQSIAGTTGLVAQSSRSAAGRCVLQASFALGIEGETASLRVRERVERFIGGLYDSPLRPQIRLQTRSAHPLQIVVVTSPAGSRGADFLRGYADGPLSAALDRVPGVGGVELLGSDPNAVKANLLPAAAVAVYPESTAGQWATASRVRTALKELAATQPQDLLVGIAYDATVFTSDRLSNLAAMLALAVAAAIGAALVLLADWRSALVLAAFEIVVLSATLIGFWLAGLSVNPVSLLGMTIAVAVAAEEAIWLLARVQHELRSAAGDSNDASGTPRGAVAGEASTSRGRAAAAAAALLVEQSGQLARASAVARAVRANALRSCAAAIALATLFVFAGTAGGVPGQVARNLLWPPAIAAAAATCVLWWLAPAWCAAWLRPLPDRWFVRLTDRLFELPVTLGSLIVASAVRRSAWVAMLLFGVLAASAALWQNAPELLLPNGHPGCIFVQARLPAGAELPQTLAVIEEIENLLLDLSEISGVISVAGWSPLDGLTGNDVATALVRLAPHDNPVRPRVPPIGDQMERLRRSLDEVRNARCVAYEPPALPALGPTAGIQLDLRDTAGQGAAVLESAALELRDRAEASGMFAWIDVRMSSFAFIDRVDRARAMTLRGDPASWISFDQALRTVQVLAGGATSPGIEVAWSGMPRHFFDSRGALVVPMLVALPLGYLALAGFWQDVVLPLAVFLAAPLTVCGALLGARHVGIEIDLYWRLGLLAASALAGKASVRFVTAAQRARAAGEPIPLAAEEAWQASGRPAATAVATVLASFAPMAVFALPSLPEARSLAVAGLGGMASAAAAGWLFVPVLYAIAQWISDALRSGREEPLDSIWWGPSPYDLLARLPVFRRPPPPALPAAEIEEQLVPGRIYTVTGSIPPEKLGTTLAHEHFLIDLAGPDSTAHNASHADYLARRLREPLQLVRHRGCRSIVECTTAGRGRNAALLKRIAVECGLQVLTNTGYDGGEQGRFLPPHAFHETADQLAERWLAECRRGIDGTGVRPGFIKIGVNAAPLSDLDRQLVRAAARTHLKSGLVIVSHTVDGGAAAEQLAILEAEGVDPSAWIWAHAQMEPDLGRIAECASRGAWVQCDVGAETILRDAELVASLVKRQLIGRLLLSQNVHGYRLDVVKPQRTVSYSFLFKTFIPQLFRAGLLLEQVEQIMTTNPIRAFTVRVRPLQPSRKVTPTAAL